MAMDQDLSIGEVARRVGLNPKTIRYYEEVGLIPPPKRRGESWASCGRRIFTRGDVERLAFIKQARAFELSLSQIKDLLEAMEEGCCSSARPHLKTFLESKLLEIDERMEALKDLRRAVQDLYQKTTEAELSLSQSQRRTSTCQPTECVFPVEVEIQSERR
jgi:DNA-binding transcriptional MerR regulator